MSWLLAVGLSNAVVATALAGAALAAGWLLRHRPALVHVLWLLVLVKLVSPPVWDVPLFWPQATEPAVSTPSASPSLALAAPENAGDESGFQAGPAAALVEEVGPPLIPVARETVDESAWLGLAIAWLVQRWQLLLGSAWLAGTVAWYVLAASRIVRFGHLLRHASSAPDQLQEQAAAIARRFEIGRVPEVYLVPGAVAPLLWSMGGRPRLYLPAGLVAALSAVEQRTLLAHELAHLRRRDHWIRYLELAVSGLFWWLPAVWLARRELREAEEQCCDAWVVWALPRENRAYANALLNTVDFLSGSRPRLPLAASGMGHAHNLRRRLTMIMRGTTPPRLTWVGGLAAVGLGALLLPWAPTWAQAQRDPPKEERKEGQEGREAEFRRALERVERELQQERRNLEQERDRAAQERARAEERERAARDARGRGADQPGGPAAERRGPPGQNLPQLNPELMREQMREQIEIMDAQLQAKRAQINAAEAKLAVAKEIVKNDESAGRAVSANEKAIHKLHVAEAEAQIATLLAEVRETEIRLQSAKRRMEILARDLGNANRGARTFFAPGAFSPGPGSSGNPGAPGLAPNATPQPPPGVPGVPGEPGAAGRGGRGEGGRGGQGGFGGGFGPPGFTGGPGFGGGGPFPGGGLGGGPEGMMGGRGAPVDQERRIAELEKKLEAIMKELEGLRRDREPGRSAPPAARDRREGRGPDEPGGRPGVGPRPPGGARERPDPPRPDPRPEPKSPQASAATPQEALYAWVMGLVR